ncbi:MAG: DNA photolyase family protein [Candidatus Eremiobacteraeota bacterium]|nr:DNA photolyase family protein [Candidatus Eremiobacteraeota bacterium]
MAVLYRFSRDLRLDDHAGLAAAAELGEIVPLLIIDESTRERISCSPRRAAFYCAAVAALADALAQRGAQLIVRRGPLAASTLAVAKETAASAVVWSASYSAPWIALERDLQSRLEERGLRGVMVHDAPAVPPEETAVEKTSRGEGYRALVPYIQTWRDLDVAAYEAPLFMRFARPAVQSEALPSPDEFGASEIQLVASPAGATAQLARFLEADALHYSSAVNVPADDRTSHLAAHLSFGTISARTIVREAKRRIDDPFLLTEERASLKKYLAALAHRDFFLQLAWFHPETQKMALQEKMRNFPFSKTHVALEAWQRGLTGYPLVDAGIRQLHATGWMHPRVRSIAASFLCFDLGVEWRAGLYEWDRHLVEDDEALAIGNWQWIAGVGADLAAYPRIYNPLKQERRFDPHGAYVRQWVPELAHRVGSALRVRQTRSLELPLFGPNVYPQPVVDHELAAREFLARYTAFITDVGGSSRQSNR